MTVFPKLKTGAVAQYPATRTLKFQNQALRFVDGSEQRYRDYGGALHRWEIPLDALDESEMAAIEAFFEENQGRFGDFAFTDPWDGNVYASCSLTSDDLALTSLGDMRGKTSLVVMENRG
jgi:Conserved hypothetical protein 2217 (DUF2460)